MAAIANNNKDHDYNYEHDHMTTPGRQRISPLRLALKNFTSQFFLIPQGTGILSVVLHQLHYQFPGLTIISRICGILTAVCLFAFLALYLLRCCLFPAHVWTQLRTAIMETACLSSIVISYTTLIQNIALNLHWAEGVVVGLWWANVALAALACVGTPYVFTKVHSPGIDWVPPGILLPLIAALTAAAGGGVVASYVAGAKREDVVAVSFLLIGLGLPLSVVVDAVFLARLMDRHFPVHEEVFKLMILCGPLGQGGFAMMILGVVIEKAPRQVGGGSFLNDDTVGKSSQFLGMITWVSYLPYLLVTDDDDDDDKRDMFADDDGGYYLQGYGTFWWAFACIAIGHALVTTPKEIFHWTKILAAWSLVFPWGVYTNAAVELGMILDSVAFNVWSTVLTVLLVLLWLVNAAATIAGLLNGKLLGLEKGWRGVYLDEVKEDEEKQENLQNGEDGEDAVANSRFQGLNAGLRRREGS
ncbi:voltage-dependent anion channel [Lecanosticta acicola]|uniref:Voltage-dependent anion channel n=1 Tax=Lecanosticta acicola TaxID=111012 RepID=A0AAI8YZ48_9PEZI|nr:voltage-dependent anion channel [Lecanosticta acicola]